MQFTKYTFLFCFYIWLYLLHICNYMFFCLVWFLVFFFFKPFIWLMQLISHHLSKFPTILNAFNPATPSFLTYTHFCYLPLFLCYFDPIFTAYNSREKRSWHWCGLMCSYCGCIETPAGIQMPLEGTAALLNGAGSCPSAFLLKCVADTSQNADTRDIVLRACHWVQSPFNAPKPSICHASVCKRLCEKTGRPCLSNSQLWWNQPSIFFIPFLPLHHSVLSTDNYKFSLAYSFEETDQNGGRGRDKQTFALSSK